MALPRSTSLSPFRRSVSGARLASAVQALLALFCYPSWALKASARWVNNPPRASWRRQTSLTPALARHNRRSRRARDGGRRISTGTRFKYLAGPKHSIIE